MIGATHQADLQFTFIYLTKVSKMQDKQLSQARRFNQAVARRLPGAAGVMIESADPSGADAQACIGAYFRELQERFDEGFDPALSVSANPEELVPPSGWFLIARLDGVPIGCVALKIKGGGYGEIKRMWVARSARGLGIAQRLLESIEVRAIDAGVDVLRLDTHRSLTEARALYLRNGYVEIAPYNSNPYAHYWFEKRGMLRPRQLSAKAPRPGEASSSRSTA